MRIGLFFKYDREVVNGSENREIPDLWGRVDRYVYTTQRPSQGRLGGGGGGGQCSLDP